MPSRIMRSVELTAAQLSERAAGYVALAHDATSEEFRETFTRLAGVYARLAVDRIAEERQATRH
jgi:hypothetical protein